MEPPPPRPSPSPPRYPINPVVAGALPFPGELRSYIADASREAELRQPADYVHDTDEQHRRKHRRVLRHQAGDDGREEGADKVDSLEVRGHAGEQVRVPSTQPDGPLTLHHDLSPGVPDAARPPEAAHCRHHRPEEEVQVRLGRRGTAGPREPE